MDMERVLKGSPWTFNNHLLILCKLEMAIQLRNFIGAFLEYDGSNLEKENRNYMRVRVQIDVRKPLKRKKQDIAEMGWNLSLRAPSRRDLSMNSIWLREEGEGKWEGSWMENRREMKGLNIYHRWMPRGKMTGHNENQSWNVRGLGRQWTVRRLRHLLKINNPQIVFFMETKLSRKQMEKARRRCGYANGIEVDSEGLPRDERMMETFRRMLEECQLNDVGFEGSWFTWERGNLPETNIQERLDRGVANTDWITLFPEVKVQHLVHSFSDHCPLLINTRRYEEQLGNNNFKFEAWWSLEESFIN
ncbi:hypothetical protein Golax_020420, partial [Gossypium laxum]|nr:hypothetical protein [Gossypium laxum]